MWEERKVEIPAGVRPEDLIKVPENAQYFAAIGAVEFGKDEDPDVGIYMGTECQEDYISVGRQAEKAKSGSAGLSASDEELAQFKQQYTIPKFIGAKFTSGEPFMASSVSTAAQPRPRQFCSRRPATSCARRINFPTATRSRTPSTCSQPFGSRSSPRVPAWMSLAWALGEHDKETEIADAMRGEHIFDGFLLHRERNLAKPVMEQILDRLNRGEPLDQSVIEQMLQPFLANSPE